MEKRLSNRSFNLANNLLNKNRFDLLFKFFSIDELKQMELNFSNNDAFKEAIKIRDYVKKPVTKYVPLEQVESPTLPFNFHI
jgi:hypothetical protein